MAILHSQSNVHKKEENNFTTEIVHEIKNETMIKIIQIVIILLMVIIIILIIINMKLIIIITYNFQ